MLLFHGRCYFLLYHKLLIALRIPSVVGILGFLFPPSRLNQQENMCLFALPGSLVVSSGVECCALSGHFRFLPRVPSRPPVYNRTLVSRVPSRRHGLSISIKSSSRISLLPYRIRSQIDLVFLISAVHTSPYSEYILSTTLGGCVRYNTKNLLRVPIVCSPFTTRLKMSSKREPGRLNRSSSYVKITSSGRSTPVVPDPRITGAPGNSISSLPWHVRHHFRFLS